MAKPEMLITIVFPDLSEDIHHGAWNARYAQYQGAISSDEADRRVTAARRKRAKARSEQRQRRPMPQGSE